MEYNKLIAELHTGDDVEGFYVLKDAFLKTTAAGKPFLSGVLADRSGVIDLKVWDYSGPIGARPDDIGRVVKIRGQVSEFKGAPQLTAGRIRMADGNDQYDLSALVPTAPIDADARVAEIERMIDSMEDREYQSVARTMLARHLDAFRSIPAAKSVHHSFLSGLLMHTSNMLRLAGFSSASAHIGRTAAPNSGSPWCERIMCCKSRLFSSEMPSSCAHCCTSCAPITRWPISWPGSE